MANQAFSFDPPVMQALRYLESAWLTIVMQAVSVSASVVGTTVFALVLCIYWWCQAERRSDATALAIGLAVSAALGQALKYIFCRHRPDLLPWLAAAEGWSFPSGHTLNAVTLAGLLAYLIGRRLSGWRRVALAVALLLWAVLVGLSRIYLGVHYPSDVLASLAVGGFFLLAGRRVLRWFTHRHHA
jgi:undecaprenyl-diphosphatase